MKWRLFNVYAEDDYADKEQSFLIFVVWNYMQTPNLMFIGNKIYIFPEQLEKIGKNRQFFNFVRKKTMFSSMWGQIKKVIITPFLHLYIH